jgi:amidase
VWRRRVAGRRELVKDTILWEIDRGERLTPAEIAWADTKRSELYHRMRRFMARYDFFVLPTVQVPPFDIAQPYPTEIDGVAMKTYIDWMKSCYYISILGNPAISVPCGFTTGEGLPVGLQIVGRHRDDWGLLQIANAFETREATVRLAPDGLTRTCKLAGRCLSVGDTPHIARECARRGVKLFLIMTRPLIRGRNGPRLSRDLGD